jgi:hypothetical protein
MFVILALEQLRSPNMVHDLSQHVKLPHARTFSCPSKKIFRTFSAWFNDFEKLVQLPTQNFTTEFRQFIQRLHFRKFWRASKPIIGEFLLYRLENSHGTILD